MSGAAGSSISTAITYPLALVVTRLQVQRQLQKLNASKSGATEYKSVVDAAQKIYAQEGISAFYAGCAQDSAKSVVDAFLFFLAYNFIKAGRLEKHGTKRLPAHEELAVGMMAGAFGRFFTTPIQNIVTRKQTAAMMAAADEKQVRPKTAREIADQIYQEKGLPGFWSGYSATLVLTINPALTFLLQEVLLRMLVKREERSKPGAKRTFIIAALSKAIASTVTYPFSLAKSRAQVASKAPAEDVATVSTGDSKEEVAKKTSENLKNQTIFAVISQIAKEEGMSSLYQGLEGEVFKGFFSHGLTMLLKERIHRVVVHSYYLLLKLAKRYPSPEDMAKSAAEAVSDTAATVTEKAAQTIGIADQESVDRTLGTLSELYRHGRDSEMDIWDEYLNTEEE